VADDRVAYQVTGEGPHDLVFTAGTFSHTDALWEDPAAAFFLRRLSSFCRVIRFDRRGTGASDPVPHDQPSPIDAYLEDTAAVMEAAESRSAVILAMLDGGPMALLFAASRPAAVSGLILYNTTARLTATEGYPIGLSAEQIEALMEALDTAWGSEKMVLLNVPSRAGDARYAAWYAKFQRAITSPRGLIGFLRAVFALDARPILSGINVPTLVFHRAGYRIVPASHGRYLAEQIPGARYEELAGADGPIYSEGAERGLQLIEEFLSGLGSEPVHREPPGRELATILFTDIVGSTDRARALGDKAWRALLDVHDEVALRTVEAYRGRYVKSTGDGVLAVFGGPGQGVRCAAELRAQVAPLGLQIRAGLHTGEIELRGADVGGIAVHLAARVAEAAEPGEVLVSRTVHDLLVGSEMRFDARGAHPLQGIAGDWELFAFSTA
jgi:class 3 adenylate cyclase/alpha-beta hydrolase superfamily lysophospholipase